MIIKRPTQSRVMKGIRFFLRRGGGKTLLYFLFLLILFLSVGVGGLYYGTKLKDSSYSSFFSSIYRYFDPFDGVISKVYRGYISEPDDLYIDMKHIDKEKLLYRVTNAKNRGKITVEDKSEQVKANITHNNKTIRVNIKLRGSYLDHVRGDKWSFRVKVKNKDALFGMSKFSLSSPETRGHIHEWIFQKFLKSEGLISLRYKFVNVFLNGKKLGIYALEEFFDKRLIENNELREGLLLKPDLIDSNGDVFVYQNKKVLKNETLSKSVNRVNTTLKMLRDGLIDIDNVIDIDKFARYFALSSIFGAQHGHLPSNFVTYFNPVTDLLEPIGYDSNVGRKIKKYGGLITSSNNAYHEGIFSVKSILTYLFSSEKFNILYIDNLLKMTRDEYYENILSGISDDLDKNLDILYKEYPYLNYFKHNFINDNAKYIINQLTSSELIKVEFYSYNTLDIFGVIVDNFLDLPIIVEGLFQGDDLIFEPLKTIKLDNNLKENQRLIKFYTSGKTRNISAERVYLRYRTYGSSKLRKVEVTKIPSNYYNDINPNISWHLQKIPNLNKFDFLKVDNDLNVIKILPGSYLIDKNIVIPEGYSVHVSPGVKVDLVNSSGILSYSNLLFNGLEEEPIIITSSDSTGQGVVVINAKNPSTLQFVNFSNLANFSKQNWHLSGSVNFYMSDVSVTNCIFSNNNSEDALNIIKSNYKIRDSIFKNTYSDAFDSDFSSGSIINSIFLKCGNDCIDFSGGSAVVENVVFDKVGDKAISAGEKSSILLKNITIKSAEIGVTSKDRSNVSVKNILIQDTSVGFTAFTKKKEYGSASINASGLNFTNVPKKYLIEKASSMTIDGEKVATINSTVESMLYGNIYGKSTR